MGPDDHLVPLANPSDPQYNFSAHQVSTTNVSKKSFNIGPIETYKRIFLRPDFRPVPRRWLPSRTLFSYIFWRSI